MVEKKTKTVLLCTCELPGCGKSWESQGEEIPKQCRWCFSRRWNGVDLRPKIILIANGETLRLAQWARVTGISPQSIRARLKAGWSEEEALGFVQREIKRERIA